MLRGLWLCVLILLLPGCTTLGKMAKVAANPDIQVGSNDRQPSTVGFSLLAEPDANPNESGEAAPVEFQLVMLAEDSRLLATDYDQVTTDIEKALAKTTSAIRTTRCCRGSSNICRRRRWMKTSVTSG